MQNSPIFKIEGVLPWLKTVLNWLKIQNWEFVKPFNEQQLDGLKSCFGIRPTTFNSKS